MSVIGESPVKVDALERTIAEELEAVSENGCEHSLMFRRERYGKSRDALGNFVVADAVVFGLRYHVLIQGADFTAVQGSRARGSIGMGEDQLAPERPVVCKRVEHRAGC